jgi:hypothetical protein
LNFTVAETAMGGQRMEYRDLTEKLNINGPNENERNVRNKIARGTFLGGLLRELPVGDGVQDAPARIRGRGPQETWIDDQRD